MAWVENSGRRLWRVRFREGGVVHTIPGFSTEQEALECAAKVEDGRRPDAPEPVVTLGSWAAQWFDVLDVGERR